MKQLTRPAEIGCSDIEESLVRELVRTNDIVLVSAIGALLDGAQIHHLVLDQNMSVIEGSLGVLPRRILVHEDEQQHTRQLLTESWLGHELRPDDGSAAGYQRGRISRRAIAIATAEIGPPRRA